MEQLIECPICNNKDRCFEDVLEDKDFSSYLCFGCGFTSNSHYTKESTDRLEHIQKTADIVRDLEFFDESRELYWYPSVINMNTLGIIFPEGTPESFEWKYAKVVPVSDGEQYPVPGKPGEFYDTKLDVENAEVFGQYEFLDACKSMGIAKDTE
jgi:hypothetical protein